MTSRVLLSLQEGRTEEQELQERVMRIGDEKFRMLRQTLPEHLTQRRENLERRLAVASDSQEALDVHAVVETKPASGPRGPPPMAGDDSARHEQKSRRVNEDMRQEYQKHLVRTCCSHVAHLLRLRNRSMSPCFSRTAALEGGSRVEEGALRAASRQIGRAHV